MIDPNIEIKKRFFILINQAIAERWEGVETEKDVADIIGIAPQQLYHVKTQQGRNVTLKMIYLFCKKFKINAHYIITGDGSSKIKPDSTKEMMKKIEKIIKG